MSDTVESCVSAEKSFDWSWVYSVLTICVTIAFLAIFASVQYWYDEANYFSVARLAMQAGLPLWTGDPAQPVLFSDSPPGFIYLLGAVSALTGPNLWLLRCLYAFVFLCGPLLALFLYLGRSPNAIVIVAISALLFLSTGQYLVELIQIRMDLPLAALTVAALVVAAQLQQSADDYSRIALWVLLFVVSALAITTKFQAICLGGAVALSWLYELVARGRARRIFAVGLVVAGGFVVGLGLTICVYALAQGGVNQVVDRLGFNVGRLTQGAAPGLSLLAALAMRSEMLLPKLVVPAMVLLLCGRTAWSLFVADPLYRQCTLLAVVVVAFNLAVPNFPGSGNYYMVQAGLPLGYVVARTLVDVIDFRRLGGVLCVLLILLLNSTLTLPKGGSSMPLWESGIRPLLQDRDAYRTYDTVAQLIAPVLGPGDLILLDEWQYQSRTLPVLLGREALHGYLYEMAPERVLELLAQTSPGQVGAIALQGAESRDRLDSPDWAPVRDAILAGFDEHQIDVGIANWTVYLRRPL